jgi:predicted MFS family arabinose efflux permease
VASMKQSQYSTQRATQLIFFLCGMAQSSWAPLVPYAKARAHANDEHFGLLLLCFGAGSLVSMPAMGVLASRYGCRRLIQIAAIGALFGLAALAVAPSSILLALSLFLFGGSIGAVDVVMNVQALLVQRGSCKNLMSGFHGLFSVGGFAGALLMSGLLYWNAQPTTAALITVALLALLLLLANPALLPYGDDQNNSAKGFAWPGKPVLLLAAIAFIMFLAEGSMLDWSALFLVAKTGMMGKNAGVGYAAFSITMTIGRLCGGVIVQKIGCRWTMTAGALVAASGFFFATLLGNSIGAIFGFALIGLGAANVVPLVFALVATSRGALGNNVSFVSTVGYAGILAGPALIGYVSNVKGLGVAFDGLAVILTLVALLCRLLF